MVDSRVVAKHFVKKIQLKAMSRLALELAAMNGKKMSMKKNTQNNTITKIWSTTNLCFLHNYAMILYINNWLYQNFNPTGFSENFNSLKACSGFQSFSQGLLQKVFSWFILTKVSIWISKDPYNFIQSFTLSEDHLQSPSHLHIIYACLTLIVIALLFLFFININLCKHDLITRTGFAHYIYLIYLWMTMKRLIFKNRTLTINKVYCLREILLNKCKEEEK